MHAPNSRNDVFATHTFVRHVYIDYAELKHFARPPLIAVVTIWLQGPAHPLCCAFSTYMGTFFFFPRIQRGKGRSSNHTILDTTSAHQIRMYVWYKILEVVLSCALLSHSSVHPPRPVHVALPCVRWEIVLVVLFFESLALRADCPCACIRTHGVCAQTSCHRLGVAPGQPALYVGLLFLFSTRMSSAPIVSFKPWFFVANAVRTRVLVFASHLPFVSTGGGGEGGREGCEIYFD